MGPRLRAATSYALLTASKRVRRVDPIVHPLGVADYRVADGGGPVGVTGGVVGVVAVSVVGVPVGCALSETWQQRIADPLCLVLAVLRVRLRAGRIARFVYGPGGPCLSAGCWK